MANWTGGWEANTHNIPRNPTTFIRSIDDLNRINDIVSSNQATTNKKRIRPPNSLTPHGPIIIQSDADFANQGWPGNGTQENPYHIADLIITVMGECVQISNTRVHFVVSNCWMEKESGPEVDIGIILTNVTNGFIANMTLFNLDFGAIILSSEANDLLNNTCTNTDTGLWISNSNTTRLINTTCTNTYTGIEVLNSDTTSLINNTCTDTNRGISVRESNAIGIINNTCSNSDFGLLIFDSSATQIINNTIKNSDYFGCEIYPVNDNILANNSLVNCGFFFGSWDSMGGTPTMGGVGSIVDVEAQITGNFVNHRPLILWLWRVGGTVPLGGGQVILLNCSRVTVQDQNLNNASIGVFLCFTTHSSVFNNTCTGHSANGIRIQNCVNISVNNNLCTNNSRSGITLDQSMDTLLTDNMCNHNSWGRGIRLFESYDNRLLNNTCNHNRVGILLEPSFGTELLNNTCNHNRSYGMWYWWEPGVGISIFGDANTARGNLCYNNDDYGIEIRGHDNNVLENTCTNNRYGIFLDSDTTPISNNLCINNRIGIYIDHYRDIIITNNIMISCGLFITYRGSEWTTDVDIRGNSVNGRPLIFYKDRVNRQVPSGAGQIILFNCRGITVRGQPLTDCFDGILVYCTNRSLFVNNVLGDNADCGIKVFNSHNNHFTGNIFINNDDRGLNLHSDCQGNIVEWNIFLDNAHHDARDDGPEFQNPEANIFDRNYWANYTGYDANWDPSW
jgi:parallel beta-helix repeat protein